MNNTQPNYYDPPIFLFDPQRQQGQIINPVTGLTALEFPRQCAGSADYTLHEDSDLSVGFSRYLYYLVSEHILFTQPNEVEIAHIIDDQDPEWETLSDEDEGIEIEYQQLWFRSPIEFEGLAGFYDGFGFCFIDGSLHSALYCEVIEAMWNHNLRTANLDNRI